MPLQEDLEKMGHTGYPYINIGFNRDETVSIMRVGYAAMSSVRGISQAMLKYCGHIYDHQSLSTEQLARLYRQAQKIVDEGQKIMDWACKQLALIVTEHEIEQEAEQQQQHEAEQRALRNSKQVIELPFKKIMNSGDLTFEEFQQVPSDGFILFDGIHYHVHVTERSIRDAGYLICTKSGCVTPQTFKYRPGIRLPRHKANGNVR